MKIILRIIIILLVAAVVSGAVTIIVNNTSVASIDRNGEGGQRPAITGSNGQPINQPLPHPEGSPEGNREGGASVGVGLLQVLITLVKLAGLTIIVLLIEKGIRLLGKHSSHPAQSSLRPTD